MNFKLTGVRGGTYGIMVRLVKVVLLVNYIIIVNT